MKDTLVLFTKSFPYKNNETFLLPELKVIHKKFKKVYIIPLETSETFSSQNILPPNTQVLKIRDNNQSFIFKLNCVILFLFYCLRIEMTDNFSYDGIIKKLRLNFSMFKQSVVRSYAIENALKEVRCDFQHICFYSYWLNENALSLALLKKRMPGIYTIGRGHGYDVFPEQAQYGYNRFQATIIASLDKIIIVSKKGTEFLKKKYSKSAHKISCSYLGTENQDSLSPAQNDRLVIVSCAHIRPIKEIHRIPEVLGALKIDCEWLHLGGFSNEKYQEKVKDAIKKANASNPNFKAVILGEKNIEDIFSFYRQTPVTFFISLSKNEGIPVSMMEAISFGIPLFSTNVGGCGEICVDGITGRTIPPNASNENIASLLIRFLEEIRENKYNRELIHNFWDKNFNSERNYTDLAGRFLN